MARRGDPGQNPTLRGRRLAMELQRRREATGMSREEVGQDSRATPVAAGNKDRSVHAMSIPAARARQATPTAR